MKRIGAEVQQELGRFGPAAGMSAIVAVWPELVGAQIALNAWPARVSRDGTLHVATSSSAWAFELAQLEPCIQERLCRTLGEDAPERLRFALGKLPEPSAKDVGEARAEPREPSSADRERAAELAAPIEDENLRKIVAEAAARSLAGRP